MIPSSSSQPSSPRTPSASSQLQQLSDVQCYTCRRRHVRCDRLLPYCKKCQKKGIECLGYQKPLRWAEGIAVRGKLKGKSNPILEGKGMSAEVDTVRQRTNNSLQETAHSEVSISENFCNDTFTDQDQLRSIMDYYNSVICAEQFDDESKTMLRIAPLTPGYVQQLPKSVVNCLLGIAAVHMASRNLEDRDIERVALKAKVNILECHNQLLRVPKNLLGQRPDILIACGVLIFAMDLLEHGLSRWMVHTFGMMHIMSSLGGIESLTFSYPHLHAPLLYCSLFETISIVTSHSSLTKSKQASRNALEVLIHFQSTEDKDFGGCSSSLLLAIWDVAACGRKLLETGHSISLTEMQERERVLSDVLSFKSGEHRGTTDWGVFRGRSCRIRAPSEHWNLIESIWKAATTILVIRYLFFGRSELVVATDTAERVQFTTWDDRYDIHAEAFSTLASDLLSLEPHIDPTILQSILVPVIILGLVSKSGSEERAIWATYNAKWEGLLNFAQGGLDYGHNMGSPIPWEKLDAYSEFIESMGTHSTELLKGSAPEWNWWDMLKHIDLELHWPVTASYSTLEHCSESWAFELIASIANKQSFDIWIKESAMQSSTPDI